MSAIPVAEDVLDADVAVITLDEAANRLGVPVNKVRQMVRDGHLIALQRGGEHCVPEDFIAEGALVKGLVGTLTVLSDAGFERAEMLDWLFTEDESLPGGTPINALRSNRGTEVKRRAQASAL
ncbi:Rv2175c family DNA-binding protein [Haloechinothrix sp. LS1_15]|uniref:Rv2175c family DNA-binding protein n=1 Tax=Haloechinothrix sp. LS1_15 TaxID=2652248 RepID=UPI00294865AA|nr:Rv2175c family DNA-binding protein [Haloechinothrix sp. LS1_15]MDV6012662.1 helix-turn-helix domain-containing protein [Haloechinothrix sp. LS1_15]